MRNAANSKTISSFPWDIKQRKCIGAYLQHYAKEKSEKKGYLNALINRAGGEKHGIIYERMYAIFQGYPVSDEVFTRVATALSFKLESQGEQQQLLEEAQQWERHNEAEVLKQKDKKEKFYRFTDLIYGPDGDIRRKKRKALRDMLRNQLKESPQDTDIVYTTLNKYYRYTKNDIDELLDAPVWTERQEQMAMVLCKLLNPGIGTKALDEKINQSTYDTSRQYIR